MKQLKDFSNYELEEEWEIWFAQNLQRRIVEKCTFGRR